MEQGFNRNDSRLEQGFDHYPFIIIKYFDIL